MLLVFNNRNHIDFTSAVYSVSVHDLQLSVENDSELEVRPQQHLL